MEVHRCRFVDYVPHAINAIKFAPGSSKRTYAAVGRSNGDIEIWRAGKEIVYEKTIPGVAKGSLEALAWAHQTELTEDDLELFDTEEEQAQIKKKMRQAPPRLFSAGLTAVIVEWDLATLTPKNAVDSYGGAVWCMSTNNSQTKLAVGTEDGHIRIFDITDGRLAYERCFDKIKSRILSIDWAPDDKTIVSGSADNSVRVWNAETGRLITRMTVPKKDSETTLVWSVVVLKDRTIVSGDSRGHVVFWDPVMYVATHDLRALDADVLCLAAAKGGNTVFASGVDPKITQLKLFVNGQPASADARKDKTEKNAQQGQVLKRWHISAFRRYHTHDVRSMAISPHSSSSWLMTGGVDTQVVTCKSKLFPESNPVRQPCFPPLHGVISVAPKGKFVLQHNDRSLKVWELGMVEPVSKELGNQMESGQALQIFKKQRCLLGMDLKAQSNLISSTISSTGHFIAASDSDRPRLFNVSYGSSGKDAARVKRIPSFPPLDFVPAGSKNRGVTQMKFTNDEKRIVSATADGYVVVADISRWQSGTIETVYRYCGHRNSEEEISEDSSYTDVCTIPGQSKDKAGSEKGVRTINCMAISTNDKYAATSDTTGHISIVGIWENQQIDITSLGIGGAKNAITALEFIQNDQLVISVSTGDILVWDIAAGELNEWSKKYRNTEFPEHYRSKMDCISGFAVNPSEPNCVYAWASSHITRIDLKLPPGDRKAIINIHKRKQIEEDVIEKVIEEKEKAEKRSEKQLSKRKKKQITGDEDGMDVDDTDTSELDTENGASSLDKDWETTVVVRLREAGIDVNAPHNFRMTQRYQNLMHVCFINPDTMVVVERPWIEVASSLPPAYHKQKYGAR